MKSLRNVKLLGTILLTGIATAALAQLPTQLDPEVYGSLPRVWQAQIPQPQASSRFFAVHNLQLYTLVDHAEGARLYRQKLSDNGPEGAFELVPVEGLPAELEIAAFEIYPDALQIAVAGTLDGKPAIYRTRLAGTGEASPWQPLPALPEGAGTPQQLVRQGEYLVLITANTNAAGEQRNGAFMANLSAPEKVFRWIALPDFPTTREGYTALGAADGILVVGGTIAADSGRRTTTQLDFLPINPPEFGAWNQASQALLLPTTTAIGANYGAGLYVAPQEPYATGDDLPSSMSLLLGFDWRGGRLSPWRQFFLAEEPAPIRTITIDPGHSWLLVLAEQQEKEALSLSAYFLDEKLQGRRLTREEIIEQRKRKQASEMRIVEADEAFDEAKEAKLPALFIITSGESEDIDVRHRMGNSRFRYMTMGAHTAYFTGERAEELKQKYGITNTPAFLLIDPAQDRILSRHEGSFPDDQSIFRLTSPIRQPRN